MVGARTFLSFARETRSDPPVGTPSDMRTWGEFALLSAIWGSSYLFIKIALTDGLSPPALVAARLVVATLFLALMGALSGARLPRDRSAVGAFAVLGVVNVAVPWLLISWGTQWIPSALSSILNSLTPLFTIIIASFVLHDEPITVNRAGGLVLGFAGAVVLATPNLGAPTGSLDPGMVLLGELAVVAAGLCYAAAAVFARHRVTGRLLMADPRSGHRAPTAMEITLMQALVGLVLVVPFWLIVEGPAQAVAWLPGTGEAWFSVLWLGILGSGFAHWLAFRVLRSWGATRMSLVTYVIPVVAIFLGVVVLGETLQAAEIAGTVMILSGVVLTSSGRGQRRIFGRARA